MKSTVNGVPPKRGDVQRLLFQFFNKHGTGIPFSQAQEMLATEIGLVISEAGYVTNKSVYKCGRKRDHTNGHTVKDVPIAINVEPRFTMPEITKTGVVMEPDKFSAFIKFGLMVEQVGGIDVAQGYLDVLRKLFK